MSSVATQPELSIVRGAPLPLPCSLRDFHGFHAGSTILVCGCGKSLSEIANPEQFLTIGVNDVGRLFQPDYLVVLNPKEQFRGDRFRFVESSRAKAIFTQLKLAIPHPHIVPIRLGKMGGVDFADPTCLHYTRNSPYLALCLAVHMGATRIGLIGVDFTEDHFFARTGQHPLSRQFPQIDREYKRLYESCRQKGIEVFNLSEGSRLTALPKMAPEEFSGKKPVLPITVVPPKRKIFFVNYKFLSCGNVFASGLTHAAAELGCKHEIAQWDDAALATKIRRFFPDLLFVVHGRRFAQKWGSAFRDLRSAVWLLDEPYEVDDTSQYSRLFDHVFLNDAQTVNRHHNARYLPVCYDPEQHFTVPTRDRKYAVGFVGGFNPRREQVLQVLASRGLLSYVVGGPWRSPSLHALALSSNMPPEQIADLYRDTRVVINVFRSQHHFNRQRIAATAPNPRIYEAIACGALVISESRPELHSLCPELPLFRDTDELVTLLERFLADENHREQVLNACRKSFCSSTYASRLRQVLQVVFPNDRQPDLSTPNSTLASSGEEIIPMPASASTDRPCPRTAF